MPAEMYYALLMFLALPSCAFDLTRGAGVGAVSHRKNDKLLQHPAGKVAWMRKSTGRTHPVMSILTEESGGDVTPASGGDIDPLLSGVLLRATSSDDLDFGSMMAASTGLKIWRTILCKGRLPIQADFYPQDIWPTEPLFSRLADAMATMQLPRFVLRNPETVSAVLLSLLRLAMNFAKRVKATALEDNDDESTNLESYAFYDSNDMLHEIEDDQNEVQLASEELEALADELAGGLIDQWGGVVGGVHKLDQIFGIGHGLLDLKQDGNVAGGAADGFGLNDGVWQHSGWRILPELQRQINSMTELRTLMKDLGRRPTSYGSDSMHKFAPREVNHEGGMGAQYDPTMRTSVSGLTLSGNISEMLPSEAVLLRGSSPMLRKLFLAKKVESKLLSYELSGWTDTPSIPRKRPRFHSRMPSAPGGAIVVCLDTSWSMSGTREYLSKAVVLACVTAAHKQRRDCQVVAFSTENGVMEAGELTANANSVRRLLDFLSYSFGGGTDVTGAFKYAMTTLGTDTMSAADLLLVTDGEIQDPPVSDDVMEDLDRLKKRTGMQVHGLLVEKSDSKPLSKVCTQTHNFLIGYDRLAATASQIDTLGSRISSALSSLPYKRTKTPLSVTSTLRIRQTPRIQGKAFCPSYNWSPGRSSTVALRAKRSDYAPEDKERGKMSYEKKKDSRKGNTSRLDDGDNTLREAADGRNWREHGQTDDTRDTGSSDVDSYNCRVEEATDKLRLAVSVSSKAKLWKVADLDKEKNGEGSCWCYRDELKKAVDRIGEGLIEREEESRLVVLGMVAREHVLLLGPPGTGKSALGRRLSKLCGGQFFQRLLTRFTTPEEIFGPLSLRALENDEYRRCTEGFLPTASVAFLDEIFKANSAILNTLLTVLNERQFDNGAGLREECPIRCVVGASNEMPESDELDALYDRFLLRKEVMPVSDDGLMRILAMPTPGVSPCDGREHIRSISECDIVFSDGLDRLIEALSAAADRVHMGNDVCGLMRDLRNYMREDLDVDISDRRLVKAARLLKISAACHGRTSVDFLDCLLLQHISWRLPEQRIAVREWLWDNLTPGGVVTDESPAAAVAPFRLLLDGLRHEALITVRKTSGDVTGASGARIADVAIIKSLLTEDRRIANLLQQRSVALARHIELLRRSMDHLWLDPDEAQATKQLLLPRAQTVSLEIDRALTDARALELALSEDPESPPNDLRVSVIKILWEEEDTPAVIFTTDDLNIGMREAKSKYDIDSFRAWKRARKKANK